MHHPDRRIFLAISRGGLAEGSCQWRSGRYLEKEAMKWN